MMRQQDCPHRHIDRVVDEYIHKPDGVVTVRSTCNGCDRELTTDVPETDEFREALERDWAKEIPDNETFHDVVSHVDEEASDLTSVEVVLEVYVEGQYEPELTERFLFEV